MERVITADKRQHVENRMETQQQLMESWRQQYGRPERGRETQQTIIETERCWCHRPIQQHAQFYDICTERVKFLVLFLIGWPVPIWALSCVEVDEEEDLMKSKNRRFFKLEEASGSQEFRRNLSRLLSSRNLLEKTEKIGGRPEAKSWNSESVFSRQRRWDVTGFNVKRKSEREGEPPVQGVKSEVGFGSFAVWSSRVIKSGRVPPELWLLSSLSVPQVHKFSWSIWS